VNVRDHEKPLTLVYDLACRYFKCDEKALPFDEHIGRSQIYIGREKDSWYIEAPRVALVGSGTRLH
jgi:hypothetical protein